MGDDNIFLSVIQNDEGIIYKPETLFVCNSRFLFPDIDVDKVYPEIRLFVETLQSFYDKEKIRVFLSVEAPYGIGPSLADKSEELVLTTTAIEGCGEMFWYLATPLGTFYLEFLCKNRNNAVVEKGDVLLTDEIRKGLFLCPCEFEYFADRGGGEITHIYPPDMPFPPLKPEKYMSGSRLEALARKYWDNQEKKEQEREAAESVYQDFPDDEPFVELFDSKDGSITRMYGDINDAIAQAQEMFRNQEISGYNIVMPDKCKGDTSWDDEMGEYAWADDDFDEDSFLEDFLDEEELEDLRRAEEELNLKIDTFHYVVRPEI